MRGPFCVVFARGYSCAGAEQIFKVAPAMDNAKNQHIFAFKTVHNHVLSDRKATVAVAQIVLTGAAEQWKAGQSQKTSRDRGN